MHTLWIYFGGKAIGPGTRLDVVVRKEMRRTNAGFLAYANY